MRPATPGWVSSIIDLDQQATSLGPRKHKRSGDACEFRTDNVVPTAFKRFEVFRKLKRRRAVLSLEIPGQIHGATEWPDCIGGRLVSVVEVVLGNLDTFGATVI